MTRITLSQFKGAARDRGSRLALPVPASAPIVTPMPSARAAVRRYHQYGPTRATAVLNQTFDRSGYWGPAGRQAARSWADAIRDCFQSYVELAGSDHRPVVMTTIDRDVILGDHAIGVALDVVLLDPDGYAGRYVLWDKPPTNQDEAELLAAPIVRALEDEFGAGRTAGVEIWHLRSRDQLHVTAEVGLSRLDEVSALLRAYVG